MSTSPFKGVPPSFATQHHWHLCTTMPSDRYQPLRGFNSSAIFLCMAEHAPGPPASVTEDRPLSSSVEAQIAAQSSDPVARPNLCSAEPWSWPGSG